MRREKKLEVAVLELRGNADEVGFVQGQQANKGNGFERLQLLQQKIDTEAAAQLLQNMAPAFLCELAGLARGAGIDQKTAIQLFSGYNIVMPPMGCSAYVNETYYVRNYDFSDTLYDGRFVFQQPASGYASVGFSQQLLGRLDGMNEKGLVIGLHFVNDQYEGEGFLATTICRLVLDQCATVDDAVALIQELPHRYCYNYSMADRSGNTAMVEATPDEQAIHRMTPITCTNHFETLVNKNGHKEMVLGSKSRKKSMQTLSNEENALNYYRTFNDQHSPLFSNHYEAFFGTLHTIVYDPKKLSVIVGVGGNAKPYTFSLERWMSGEEVLPRTIEGTIYV